MKIKNLRTKICSFFVQGCLGSIFLLPTVALGLDLAETYELVLKSNYPALSAQKAEFRRVQAVALEQKLNLWPSLSAEFSTEVKNNAESGLYNQNFYEKKFLYSINLSYPLISFADNTNAEQAQLEVTHEEIGVQASEQDLILRTAQVYFGILRAKEDLDLLAAERTSVSEQLAAAQRNFKIGNGTIADQYETEARWNAIRAEEIAAQNNYSIKESELLQLLKLNTKTSLSVSPLKKKIAFCLPSPQKLSEWVSASQNLNSEIQQKKIKREVSKKEIEKARYSRYPTLELLSSLGSENFSFSEGNGVSSSEDGYKASVELRLAIPLDWNGLSLSKIAQAEAELDKSSAYLSQIQEETEQKIQEEFFSLTSGVARISAVESALESSRLALNSNKIGYDSGLRSNGEVLAAQEQFFSRKRDMFIAQHDWIIKSLELKKTIGILNISDLKRVNLFLEADTHLQSLPTCLS